MAKPPKDYIDVVNVPTEVTLQVIGRVEAPYRERHGTPRQATVKNKPAMECRLVLDPKRVPKEALLGMAGFDYVWIIAWLHLNQNWNPTVVPPRGPRVRRGVLATRAPHRPNPLGLSAARLIGVEGHTLTVLGLDLLDQTPILDVKPYIPYADAFENASAGWVDEIDGRDPSEGPGRD